MNNLKLNLITEILKFDVFTNIRNKRYTKGLLASRKICSFCENTEDLLSCHECKVLYCKNCFNHHNKGPVLGIEPTFKSKLKPIMYANIMGFADGQLLQLLCELKCKQIFRVLRFIMARCYFCRQYLTPCECDSYYHVCINCFYF